MYKLTRDNNSIIRLTDGAHIPMAPGNRDYREYHEWLSQGNSPQAADVPTLAVLKQQKQLEIARKADEYLAAMAAEYGAYEKLTWDQQALEADALVKDAGASAPLVRAIAQGRGMDPLVLAQRIVANRAQWVVLSGMVVGKRLSYQDALDKAMTPAAVEAINPVFG